MSFIKTILGVGVLVALSLSAQNPGAQGEKAYFWFRMWPGQLVKYDIEKDEVALQVESPGGVAHGMQLSHDRSKFFLVTNQKSTIESYDSVTGEFLEQYNFAEPGYIIRIDQVRELPGGTHWYVKIDKVKRETDHFKVEEAEWLLYDHAEWHVDKRMKKLPKEIGRSARISPDGTKWHVMGKDITILDPKTLKEEGKIELSKPLYTGMGPISVRGEDFYDWQNPKAYKMIYRMRDPVKKDRSLGGIVEIDLVENKIAKLTEWGASLRSRRLFMTRDKKLGIGTKSTGERREQSDGDDPVATLINYDLETGKKLLETRVEVRNGLNLAGISPDGTKIYFMGRGHELVIFTGEHVYLKTVDLGGEVDGRLTLLYE